MELTYNGVELHKLGDLSLRQSRQFEGGEQPQRAKTTLTVTLDTFEGSYFDNLSLLNQARTALKVQHAQLVWQDSATNTKWIDQTATVLSDNLPEEWGTHHQRLEIVFEMWDHSIEAQNLVLTLDGSAKVTLNNVEQWHEELTAELVSTLHSNRREATVRLAVAGKFLPPTTDTLAVRRTNLEAQKTALMELAKASPTLTLTYGTFSRTVKLTGLKTELDEATHALRYSFSAQYTAFPDESDYTLATFSASERDPQTGELFLSLSGRIQANSETAARARMTEIQGQLITAYGYAAGQVLSIESEAGQHSASARTPDFMELTFRQEIRKYRPDNLAATFRKTGINPAVSLGNILHFNSGYNAKRFHELRSQRSHAPGRVSLRGTWSGGTLATPLATRRTALFAQHNLMMAHVNGADGVLTYGSSFTKTVRVTDFRAEINEAITDVEWSMEAEYSLFPNEANYATVEFTVAQRTDEESGEILMSVSGRIGAPSETVARAKLTLLLDSVVPANGFTAAQLLRTDTTAAKVFANGDKTSGLVEAADGTTFTELQFTSEYRRRLSTVAHYTLTTSTRTDTRSGLNVIAYSGTVTATDYASALARAQQLGADKHTFCLSDSIQWSQRKTRTDNPAEFLTLEFTYEYQTKSAVLYLEMESETTTDTFGLNVESVSGSITAADYATALARYNADVRAGFTGQQILGESLTSSTQKKVDGTTTATLDIRLSFRISAHQAKAPGEVTYRYSIETNRNFATLEQATTLSGSVWADTAAAAETAVEGLITSLALTGRVQSRRARSQQKSTLDTFQNLEFSETFVTRMTGTDSILQCEVSESIQYSSVRWVVQDLPRTSAGVGGISVPQDCGIIPGSRQVRGTVVAGSEAAARTWALTQRALITGDHQQPPMIETSFQFAPMTDGISQGTGVNVQLYRVSFSYSEILLDHPLTV